MAARGWIEAALRRIPTDVRTRVTDRISLGELKAILVRTLRAVGASAEEADLVADSLVAAEARGLSTHGVGRLETYLRRVNQGLIRTGVPVLVVVETPATLVLDAQHGFGHVAGTRAMDRSVEKARAVGVGVASVRNSSHFGIASVFAARASERGCIGIVTSNAAPRMPPIGARTAVIGTNPLAIAVPGPSGTAFLLDMATSVAALGRILKARDLGQLVPEGWALTPDGLPTTSAVAAADGLLLPMAGPKGFGLALALEVLSAVLSGANAGQHAGSMYRSWDRPEGLGHFFMALSVEAFGPRASYDAAIDDLMAQVHDATPLHEGDRILLPGELEAQREEIARSSGLVLTDDLRTALHRAAAEAGISIEL